MADRDFKKQTITFPANWKCNSKGSIIGEDQYKPDQSFKNEKGDVICVIESSSTNDRKVGVGELCLADKFFTDKKVNGILIFSLCGKSASPPRPISQKEYIEPYFHHLKSEKRPYGVSEIYFINQVDFEALNWVALDESFKQKSLLLSI